MRRLLETIGIVAALFGLMDIRARAEDTERSVRPYVDVTRLSLEQLKSLYLDRQKAEFQKVRRPQPEPEEIVWALSRFRDDETAKLLLRATEKLVRDDKNNALAAHTRALGIFGRWNQAAYHFLLERLQELKEKVEQEQTVREAMRLHLAYVIHALALTTRSDATILLKTLRKDKLIRESNSGDLVEAEFYRYLIREKGLEFLEGLYQPGRCAFSLMEEFQDWQENAREE